MRRPDVNCLRMKMRVTLSILLAVLWAFFLVLYIAAKVHFFTRYDAFNAGRYVGEHSIYWLGMALTVFLIWLVERFRRRTTSGMNPAANKPRRELTQGESAILGMIQEGYGLQNVVDEVFFTDRGEAAIFVKASDGTSPLMANLTNLAEWRANGMISSDEDLKRDWLRLR
jgi:hypothetical protein